MNPFDAQTEAAASDKSSTEIATGIISDLRQHNYGNAERNAVILIAQLEREEQERRKATARPAEIKPDAFEAELGRRLAMLNVHEKNISEVHIGAIRGYEAALRLYQYYKKRSII